MQQAKDRLFAKYNSKENAILALLLQKIKQFFNIQTKNRIFNKIYSAYTSQNKASNYQQSFYLITIMLKLIDTENDLPTKKRMLQKAKKCVQQINNPLKESYSSDACQSVERKNLVLKIYLKHINKTLKSEGARAKLKTKFKIKHEDFINYLLHFNKLIKKMESLLREIFKMPELARKEDDCKQIERIEIMYWQLSHHINEMNALARKEDDLPTKKRMLQQAKQCSLQLNLAYQTFKEKVQIPEDTIKSQIPEDTIKPQLNTLLSFAAQWIFSKLSNVFHFITNVFNNYNNKSGINHKADTHINPTILSTPHQTQNYDQVFK